MAACRSPRPTAVALLLGLVAAGCASTDLGSDHAYETADRILATAETEADVLTAGAPELLAATADCELETREDEYGLEFEVCVAAVGDSPTTPGVDDTESPTSGPSGTTEPMAEGRTATVLLPIDRFDDLVTELPVGAGREQLNELGSALATLDEGCETSLEAWERGLLAVIDQLAVAEQAVVADPGLVGLIGESDARELARVIVERVMIPSGCVDPATGGSPSGGLDAPAIAERSAQAAAAVEPIYQWLWGQAKSPFFYHPDELAHRQWMRTEVLGGVTLDVVVVGTSQTLLGIEADLLGAQLELEAGNAALPGAVAEVQQHWLPEVVEAIDPATVLWGIGPLDLVTICQPDGRAEEFVRLSTLKKDLLGHVPAAATIPPFDLIVGPPGSDAYASAPTSIALDRRFPNPRGDAFEFAQPDPAQLRASLEQFRAPFERGDYCSDRLPVIEATIADLVERGHRVVVFGTPLAPSLAATYDGGMEALHGLVDAAALDVFEPAGADYLGMMTSIDDDQYWYDVVHPTRAGGERLTAEVATALAGAG